MRAWAAVALAWGVATVAFWWPLPAHLGTHVWGDRFDAWTTLWLVWHLADRGADVTAVTDRILYPLGYNLWSFGHVALQAIGAGLVRAGVPLVVAYNLLLLGGHWASAMAAHGLGREVGGSHRAGFAAGIVFATSPWLYGEGAAGCVELVAAGWLPLCAWLWVRLARAPGWRRAAAAALALACVGPFNWYFTLFAGMFGVGFAAWQLVAGRRVAAAWIAGSMLVAAALDAPLVPLVRRETPTRPPLSAALFTDAAAWARAGRLADGRLPLADLDDATLLDQDALQVVQNQTSLVALAHPTFTANPLASTPGGLAWVVGLVGVALARGRARGWLAIAVGATVLTLGPWPMVDAMPPLPAWAATIPLPYGWAYTWMPLFAKAYRPYRIGVVALTALAAAAGAGMAGRGRRWDVGLVVLGVVAVTQPFWAGDRPGLRPLADAAVPAVYQRLRDLPDGAAIELPLRVWPLSVAASRLQYAQVVHAKPLLNCNQLIRRTDLAAFRDYALDNPLLTLLVDRPAAPWRVAAADVAALLDDGFRYLVLHPRVPVGGPLDRPADDVDLYDAGLAALVRDLFGAPVLDDADAQVYAIAPSAGVRTWTGADVVDVALPVDARALGLPLRTSGATLWRGRARGVSLWARGTGEPLRVTVTGQPDAAAPLVTDAWTRVEVPVAAEGEVEVGLAGGALVTRMQVVTR